MGKIKGEAAYERFTKGIRLTRNQAIIAKCYECNGYKESGVDCEIKICPIYPYHPHRR